MTHVYADRVKEVTLSNGEGALALAGAAPGGFRPFGAVMAVGDTTDVCIENPATGEWEVCRATLLGPTTLDRGQLHASSTGARVAFGAGEKHVFIVLPSAEVMRRGEIEAALAGKADAAATAAALAEKADAAATAAALAGKANAAHSHGVADIAASGTRDGTTFLRGDGVWAALAGGGTYAEEELIGLMLAL